MKVAGCFHGSYKSGVINLVPSDKKDAPLIEKLFASKKEREARRGGEILLSCTIDAPFQKRTVKEVNTAFKLISLIFESQEGRKPAEDEKLSLYYDLLEVLADKVPVKGGEKMRPVHLSEANTIQAARFIDGLLYELCMTCDLTQDLQADAREIIYEWEIWRGQQKEDFTASMSEIRWRRRAVYSEASGIGGQVELHHILTRAAFPQFENDPDNWIALTPEEHREFHALGRDSFLQKYPHLTGRLEKIERKARGEK